VFCKGKEGFENEYSNLEMNAGYLPLRMANIARPDFYPHGCTTAGKKGKGDFHFQA